MTRSSGFGSRLTRARAEIASRLRRGDSFTDVESELIDPGEFTEAEKAALWLYGWSFVPAVSQRREANAHIERLVAASRGTEPAAPTVLLCDHAPGYRMMLAAFLDDAGLDVSVCGTWPEAVECAAEHQPDAIVVGLWMPTFERELLQRVREVSPRSVIVGVTTEADDVARRAVDGIDGITAIVSRHERLEVIVHALSDALPGAVPTGTRRRTLGADGDAAQLDERWPQRLRSHCLALAPLLAAGLLEGSAWTDLLAAF